MKEDSIALATSRRFLWLGVVALAFAGLFALALVVARTPQLAAAGISKEFFSVALVVHVDLSVLVWFLAMAGMGWSLLIARLQEPWPYWQNGAFVFVALAIWFIAISPFSGEWDVIKSNYIPVLDNHLFLLALALLFAGVSAALIQLLFAYARPNKRRALSYVDLGWLYAGFTTALAIVAFFLTARTLPEGMPRDDMFETLFWAGGHSLQFSYMAVTMAAWLVLLQQITSKEEKTFWIFVAYAVLAAGAIASIAGFALYPDDMESFRLHQSKIMIQFLGIGPAIIAAIVLDRLCRAKLAPDMRAFAHVLVTSLLLFFVGGALGLSIRGQNVTIPAHYHGEIVAMTLALMGVAYAMLPRFGYPSVAHTRLARWQPVIYGVGQLMHIGGLAYSGGYGVLRKTADAATEIAPNIKIAMGIMGLGGLLAVIGGLLFVVVMLKAFFSHHRVTPSKSV